MTALAQYICPDCGVHFWIESNYAQSLSERKTACWCPNGHVFNIGYREAA